MDDHQIAALVGAVRAVVDEQVLTVRAQVESLRAEVEKLRSEVFSLRGADQRAEKLLNAFARTAGEALPVAVAQAVQRGSAALATRVDALEQRAMPSEGAAQ